MVERKGIYSIETVLSKTLFIDKKEGKKQKVCFDGEMINMASQRYQVFKTKGIVCCKCGIQGIHFIMERHYPHKGKPEGPFHFNLYAIDKEGSEVLMTKDHIIPKSKGGKDFLNNFQTMCEPCNANKGDNLCHSE